MQYHLRPPGQVAVILIESPSLDNFTTFKGLLNIYNLHSGGYFKRYKQNAVRGKRYFQWVSQEALPSERAE